MPSVVQQVTGALSVAGTSTTLAVTATPGNSLILAIGLNLGPTGSVTAVTDTGGNTWSLPDPPYGGASGGASTLFRVAYVHDCVDPGTITVTHSSGSSQISVIEVSGLANAAPTAAAEDVANAATTTSLSSGSLTAGAGDFVFGVIEHGGAGTVSGLPAGWTALADPPSPGVNVHLRTAYVSSSAGGTEQMTYTVSPAARYAGGIISFPVAAGPATAPAGMFDPSLVPKAWF